MKQTWKFVSTPAEYAIHQVTKTSILPVWSTLIVLACSVVSAVRTCAGSSSSEQHSFNGVGFLTGKRTPEANGYSHPESNASSAPTAKNSKADSTTQKLSFGLLEGHGFGQVAYAQWKAACLRERAKLGKRWTSTRQSAMQLVSSCLNGTLDV